MSRRSLLWFFLSRQRERQETEEREKEENRLNSTDFYSWQLGGEENFKPTDP